MLYPRENEFREVKDLSGLWNFKIDKDGQGISEKWFNSRLKDTILMPVPASYNDMTQDKSIRDHMGDVYYERDFFVPCSWKDKRVMVRVGSATHHAVLWANGEKVATHKGGYMPFEADISALLSPDGKNRLTILVNNILDWTTLPPGEIKSYDNDDYPKGYKTQEYFHDFFNYSGLHRPVRIYCTSKTYIDDITVETNISGETGLVSYDISVVGNPSAVQIRLLDKEGHPVGEASDTKGTIRVEKAHLWNPGNPYLYTLEVYTKSEEGEDCYRLPVGIRTVSVTQNEFLINGKPFYFTGFGKHEDMDIKGKGMDNAVNVKDFNLLKWINANSFRTSHYPYSEEIMNLADELGIVVIDETPAVGMNFWSESSKVFSDERIGTAALEHHLQVINELYQRDKNHPCVVMWSVANEAATYEEAACPYFEKVINEIKGLDSTRPVTIVADTSPIRDKVCHLADVICYNSYNGWYTDPGHLEVIEHKLEKTLVAWYEKYKKLIIASEFGTDTIAGLHSDPPVMFSEEYQIESIRHYQNVFDRLPFVIGEHIWCFADFATKQGVTRVIGNRKGVFTRQRQPKSVAFMLKDRWSNIINR